MFYPSVFEPIRKQSQNNPLRIGLCLLISLSLSLVFDSPHATSQMKTSSQPVRLLVGYGAIGGNTAHLSVLEHENIFKKYGLDVSFIYMGGGTRGIQALVAGDISVCVIGGSTAITAILRGADIKILATTHYALDYWVFASKKLKLPPIFVAEELA